MRIFQAETLRLEVDPEERWPTLFLPAFVPAPHHEQIIGLFSQTLGPSFRRLDLSWHGEFFPSAQRMLRRYATNGEPGEALIVVTVEGDLPIDDLRPLLVEPALEPFSRLVVRCQPEQIGHTLRALSQLAHQCRLALLAAWETRAPRLGLEGADLRGVAADLADLLDPVEQIQMLNDLAAVCAEGLSTPLQRQAVRLRLLRRQMGRLSSAELVAVLDLLARRERPRKKQEAALAAARQSLGARELLREGRLLRWASWLHDGELIGGLLEDPEALGVSESRHQGWKRVLGSALRGLRQHQRMTVGEWPERAMGPIFVAINRGELEQARVRLNRLWSQHADHRDTPAWSGAYHLLVGLLKSGEGDTAQSLNAFSVSIEQCHQGALAQIEGLSYFLRSLIHAKLKLAEQAFTDMDTAISLQSDLFRDTEAANIAITTLFEIIGADASLANLERFIHVAASIHQAGAVFEPEEEADLCINAAQALANQDFLAAGLIATTALEQDNYADSVWSEILTDQLNTLQGNGEDLGQLLSAIIRSANVASENLHVETWLFAIALQCKQSGGEGSVAAIVHAIRDRARRFGTAEIAHDLFDFSRGYLTSGTRAAAGADDDFDDETAARIWTIILTILDPAGPDPVQAIGEFVALAKAHEIAVLGETPMLTTTLA